jgi:hypothetical protein
VSEDVNHGVKILQRSRGRTGSVQYQTLLKGARSGSRKAAQRIRQAHGFGQTWRFALDDRQRGFRSHVAGRKTGATGRDEKAGEARRHLAQRRGNDIHFVWHNSSLDNEIVGVFEAPTYLGARTIIRPTREDRIRNGKNFCLKYHVKSVGDDRPTQFLVRSRRPSKFVESKSTVSKRKEFHDAQPDR